MLRYQEEARENRGHSRRWGVAEQRELEERQRLREETLASKDREKEMDAIKVCHLDMMLNASRMTFHSFL